MIERWLTRWGALAALVVLTPSGWGCAACFGKSDSPLAKGLNMGILSLLVVVLGVVGGIIGCGIYFARRAAAFNRAAEQAEAAAAELFEAPVLAPGRQGCRPRGHALTPRFARTRPSRGGLSLAERSTRSLD